MNTPLPQLEIQIEFRRDWHYYAQKQVEISKSLKDQQDSVNEFKAWKLHHTNDGTMTVLYSWSPQIIAGSSIIFGLTAIITANPFMIGMSMLGVLRAATANRAKKAKIA